MSKTYRNLWVFGDCYSTPFLNVKPADSFWMLVADLLQVQKVINYSWPGNSFESVLHTLISDSAEYDWEHDFFLIGIPILHQLTTVSQDTQKSYHRRIFNQQAKEIAQEYVLCHAGLENISYKNDPMSIVFKDPTWRHTQVCRSIFLLNSWLDQHKANYLIANLGKGLMNDKPATGKFVLEKCYNHPRNILFQNTYYDVNVGINRPPDYDQLGWFGHHGPDGNRYFFDKSLLPKINECGLC